ncbi:integrase arm-type DNA-binding domain-containing protein [Ursidibacter arcticus]
MSYIMPKVIKPLTATEVKNAKSENSPLQDGYGLSLIVTEHSKRWCFRYSRPITKKRNDISLGAYPEISLLEARALRDEYRAMLADGIDPSDYRKQRKREQEQALLENQNTFENVSIKWRDNFKSKRVMPETMAEDWRRLENHIFPLLANVHIEKINSRLLVDVLLPVYKKGHTSVIEKVLRTVCSVMDYAENTGLIEIHNCHKARKSFNFNPAQNNPTIPPNQLPKFVRDMLKADIQPRTLLLIFWQLLTAVRPSEAVEAEWTEIDFDQKLWHIPKEKMKGRKNSKKAHSVPLSMQALAILRILEQYKGGSRFVFQSISKPHQPMSSETVNVALKRNGYKGILTGHGMRSIVRTYLAQQGVLFR